MGAFKINRSGVSAILKRAETARIVKSAADRTAAESQARTEFPVEVDTYTTDRAAASVTIAHPAGAAEQAKNGTLTRGASSAGLDVGGAR